MRRSTITVLGALLLGLLLGLCAFGVVSLVALGVGSVLVTLLGVVARGAQRRRAVARVLVALLAAVLTLAGLELGLRALQLHPAYYRPHDVLLRRWPRDPRLLRYAPAAHLEMDGRGDLAAMAGDRALAQPRRLRFSTDLDGFRVVEGAGEAARGGGPRVILLGDSFGCGNGTSQEDVMASVLARDHGHAVTNLSIGGHNAWQELATLMHEADRLQLGPQDTVVWLLFPANDLEGDFAPGTELAAPAPSAARQAWQRYRDWRRRSPVGFVLQRLRHRLGGRKRTQDVLVARLDGGPLLFHRPYVRQAARTRAEAEAHRNRGAVEATFAAMASLREERGFHLLIVLLPCKAEVYGQVLVGQGLGKPGAAATPPSGLADLLRDLATSHGLEVLDLFAPLRVDAERARAEDDSLLWWRDDTHLNPRGHAAVAALIDGWLRRPR